MTPRPGRPTLTALLSGLTALIVLCAAAAVAMFAMLRGQLVDASSRVEAAAVSLPALKERPLPAEIAAYMAAVPFPATLTGKVGQPVAQTGTPSGIWGRGPAPWTGRWAAAGTDARLVDGAVEVVRDLGNGRAITMRQDIGTGATGISARAALIAGIAALVLALLTAVAVFLAGRRRRLRVAALAGVAEAVAGGRSTAAVELPSGEFERVGAALRASAERLSHLQEVADRELGVLTAAIEPLPIGVAGRGPTGGNLRNLALERLTEGVAPDERTRIDVAIKEALDGTGPVGERVTLRDGRILEVDGWSVPGGRLASVAERTEQERLAHLRRQLESSAVRQLRAPIDEIIARGRELYQQVPAPAASKLRSIFAATDRLDRVVRMLLRGTPHDPALRPPRRETFGVAGLLWGLVHDWDSALRQRALRVELDVAPDLPDVRTDPALVEEILTELIDNSAKYTPRGGTIALSARAGDGSVIIEVRDSGTGFADQDVPNATERFFRGQHAESIPGAGLGLGVASALAERLGGTLVIQAGPGGQVRLELPARVSTFEPELAASAAPAG